MALKVVMLGSDVIPAEISDPILGELEAEVVRADCSSEAEVVSVARDAQAVIKAGGVPFTRSLIEGLERCQIISCWGVATYDVDLAAATERGICVSHMPDLTTEEMTDHCMALILACARRLLPGHQLVKARQWKAQPEAVRAMGLSLRKLNEQTLGLVGFGRAGASMARKAKGFGMRVLAHDPFIPPEVAERLGVELVDLDRVLAESDYISLHAPLTPQTHNMFNRDTFGKMKPTSYIINATGSGALINEEALYRALKEGIIAGAGLDTTEPMPIEPDNPLLELDNILWTPHIGFQSASSVPAIQRRMCENVVTRLKGQWPELIVNPQVKARVSL